MFPFVYFITKSRFTTLVATQRSRCSCVGGVRRHTKLQAHCRRHSIVCPCLNQRKCFSRLGHSNALVTRCKQLAVPCRWCSAEVLLVLSSIECFRKCLGQHWQPPYLGRRCLRET
ncbi:unnamed protein product [Ixodes pacificus]